jgi:hypothetical protein
LNRNKDAAEGGMLRFLVRALGFLAIAGGFVMVVIDGTRTLANGALSFMALGEAGFRLLGEKYLLIQPGIERHLHPLLWDPFILNLTLMPASLVLLAIGLGLVMLGRKPADPIGFDTRK